MLSVRPWRGDAVAQFIAMQLLCFCFGLLAVGVLQKAGFSAFKPPAGAGGVLVITLAFQGVTWLLIPFFLRQHGTGFLEALGFRGPRLTQAILAAMAMTLFILPVAWWLQGISIGIWTRLGWPPEEETAVALIAGAQSLWLRIYLAFFAIILAPVAEEFIFRGMLYPLVKQLGSRRCAWFGVNAIFALVHLDLGALVPLFVLALALTWLYERTDNLLAPIAAHSLFNTANLALLHFQDPLDRLLQKFGPAFH